MTWKEAIKKRLVSSLSYLLSLLLVGVVIGLLFRFTPLFDEKQSTEPVVPPGPVEPPPPPPPAPSEFPDWEAYSVMDKKLELVSDQESYVSSANSIVGRVNKTISRTGVISQGYLYVRVHVAGEKPLTIFDSAYVRIDSTPGHLFRPNSLDVPPSETTELLFGLQEVPYLSSLPYSETRTPSKTNWLSIINALPEVPFSAFLSSNRRGGHIEEISIGYLCAEDEEGVETDCSLKAN